MNLKKSKLYTFVIQTIDGKNIDEFDLGKSSKDMLKTIKYFWDKDSSGEFKTNLLNSKKITLSLARRMIFEEQSTIRLKELAEEQKNELV